MALDDKVLGLMVTAGGCWTSSSTFHKEGTVEELKGYFQRNMDTGYSLRPKDSSRGTELVTPEFFQEAGKYLIETLEYRDLMTVTGTLEAINENELARGGARIDEHQTLFHTYAAIESEEFEQANKEDRLALIVDVKSEGGSFPKEAIASNAAWTVAANYMDSGETKRRLERENSELRQGIQKIWDQEVCEKSIFPYLERIAS